MKEDEDIGYTW